MSASEENITFEENVRAILKDRTKVNNVVDIITELDDVNPIAVVVKAIKALRKIFTSFVISGECPTISKPRHKRKQKKTKDSKDPVEIFHSWLQDNYKITVKKLLSFILHSDNHEIQEQSLMTLMEFVETEGQKLCQKHYIFPNELFYKIVHCLVGGSSNMEHVIKVFKPYLQYSDISYYLLRNLNNIISKFIEQKSVKTQGYFSKNVYSILRQVTIPQSEDELHFLFTMQDENQSTENGHNVTNLTSHKKVFSGAWISFLNLSLETEIHRKVLVILHEKVMPYLLDPKLLMDFLTDSYNVGGVTSILSLNSLFILIHNYNLDYPDFYKKLYSLFNVDIFHMKYRARFFYLADLFLMSTHLPAYLVAAFIKRLSRIALRAPPYGVTLIITFIGNLIKRHPNCKVLIHRKKEKTEDTPEVAATLLDPFIESEDNPDQCKALESSLWEIETLRQHYYPEIKSLVELFEKPKGKTERDLSEYFDSTYESLFEDECVELTKSNSFVEFHMPKMLFSEAITELWDVE